MTTLVVGPDVRKVSAYLHFFSLIPHGGDRDLQSGDTPSWRATRAADAMLSGTGDADAGLVAKGRVGAELSVRKGEVGSSYKSA